MVFEKFDKDQYPLLLGQFDTIRQLAHAILLYNPAFNDTYMVTKFVGGLKEEIRSAIMLHRPKDVDTASALALIQEDELENSRKKFSARDPVKSSFKSPTIVDKTKPVETEKGKAKLMEDKFGSLKAYRRQNGLCFKCGNKWSPGHKCPDQVSIHVLEELWYALDDSQDTDSMNSREVDEPDGIMAIGEKRKTMRLCGIVGNMELLILVDSGSVKSFISTKVAELLKDQL